jgi:phospholipid-binding lipoprotein MlaA
VSPDPANPPDPLEHLNRDTYRMNDKLDRAIIKPLSEGYSEVLPYPVRESISNFFDNLDGLLNINNDILQGDVRWALSDSWRFIINSTVGVGGLFDVATHMGLVPHENDFDLTLNRWNIYLPYTVVPFVGPRTLGGVIAFPVNYYLGIGIYLFTPTQSFELTLLYGLNLRANLLAAENASSGFMLDPYVFMRNAYLQDREYMLSVNKQGPYFPGFDDPSTESQ